MFTDHEKGVAIYTFPDVNRFKSSWDLGLEGCGELLQHMQDPGLIAAESSQLTVKREGLL